MMQAKQPEIQTIEPSLDLEKPVDPRGLGGLVALAEKAEHPLPLRGVKVRAVIAGDCCHTVIEQQFQNHLESPLEAVHIFPLPEDGAVVAMELRAGDVRVVAECREREEAEEIFEQARQAGHRAGLLTQERPDVHTLRVTNLPPHSEVKVRIEVVERLDSIDGQQRWRFPTVIAPRYLPGKPIGHSGPGALPDTDQAPDASRLAPPLRLEGGVELDLEVAIYGRLTTLESSLHAVRVEWQGEESREIRVAPTERASLNKDFALAFSSAERDSPALRAWTDGEYTLALLESPLAPPAERLPRDAVFVIDRSGSMDGRKMSAAKLALKTALHGLVAGDRFKLIAFDNETIRFSEGFSAYTEETLQRAGEWVDAIEARGGTKMLPAIRAALSGEAEEGRSRSVVFITDGQAHNVDELVAAVANRRDQARFFTLGIDTAVHSSLLKRLARAGGGTCELLAPSDDIETAVARMEARLGDPLIDDLRFQGGRPAADASQTLFYGRTASALLEGAADPVVVKGRSAEGDKTWTASPESIDLSLGALWARERIAWLEDRMTLKPWEEEAIRAEIIRLGLAHKVASRFTAFVAVDTSVTEEGERVEIIQPVELPQGWDPAFRGPGPSAPFPKSATALRSTFAPNLRSQEETRLARMREAPQSPPLDELDDDDSSEISGRLARLQGADGSYGGDVDRTAAALIALILLGSTRRAGLRRRAVSKAARWLAEHREYPSAALSLDALDRAESGADLAEIKAELEPRIQALFGAGEEGELLAEVLAAGGA